MKFFWWGQMDEISGYLPALYCTTVNEGFIQKFNPVDDVPELLADGCTEITTRTAHALGLPT